MCPVDGGRGAFPRVDHEDAGTYGGRTVKVIAHARSHEGCGNQIPW